MKTDKIKLHRAIYEIRSAGFERAGNYGEVSYRMSPSPSGTDCYVVLPGQTDVFTVLMVDDSGCIDRELFERSLRNMLRAVGVECVSEHARA